VDLLHAIVFASERSLLAASHSVSIEVEADLDQVKLQSSFIPIR